MEGWDPRRGFDMREGEGRMFWDTQCGAKETEHLFPNPQTACGDGLVQGRRVTVREGKEKGASYSSLPVTECVEERRGHFGVL